MILKTLSRKSNTGQLVKYIFRYIFKEQKTASKLNKEKHFILTHNIRSQSLKGIVKEYEKNESFRIVHRKDSVKLFHTILSFSYEDKVHITDAFLRDIFKKFVSERGMDNLYAGTKHEDKAHTHLHICVSGVKTNGYSSRVSKSQLHHLKIELDKYQNEKYPELANSLPEHGKGKKISKENVLQTIISTRQTNKLSLISSLKTAYANAESENHFIDQLKKKGLDIYFRNGRPQGIKIQGTDKKFRLSNLGFDTASLKLLDHGQYDEMRQIEALRNLRNHKKIEFDQSKVLLSKNQLSITTDKAGKLLDELVQIRYRRNQKEKEQEIDREVCTGGVNAEHNGQSEITALNDFRNMRPIPFQNV